MSALARSASLSIADGSEPPAAVVFWVSQSSPSATRHLQHAQPPGRRCDRVVRSRRLGGPFHIASPRSRSHMRAEILNAFERHLLAAGARPTTVATYLRIAKSFASAIAPTALA